MEQVNRVTESLRNFKETRLSGFKPLPEFVRIAISVSCRPPFPGRRRLPVHRILGLPPERTRIGHRSGLADELCYMVECPS